MRTYVWSDDYSVGEPEIDAQHKRIFTALREFQLDLYGEVNPIVVKERIVELQAYCLEHFAAEAAYFTPYQDQLDIYDVHVQQHEKFVVDTNVFARRAETEGAELVKELCLFLSEWLVNHILHTDKQTFLALHALTKNK